MQTTPTDKMETATKSGSSFWKALILIFILVSFAAAAYYFTKPQETPFTKAVALIKQNKAAFALPMLEELQREQPENPEVYPWLAQGYLAAQRYAEGRTALDTAMRLKLSEKQVFPVIKAYADYYQQRGDFDEAEKLYQSAGKLGTTKLLDEGRARLYVDWADANMSVNDLKEAVHHLQLAESLSGSLDETTSKSIPHMLSDCYRRQAAIAETVDGNDTEAIRLLEKSLSVCDEPLTRIALASIYARVGRTKQAIENYEFVSKEDPNNLEVRHHLIDLLLEKEDYERAQEALLGLTDREKSVENYELLADVNLKIGNYAGAVRALEEASTLRPTPELLEKLKDTLLSWSELLMSEKKVSEATSVKGHAERVAEKLALLTRDDQDKSSSKQRGWDPKSSPVAIVFSRTWLAKDSMTPEGKIKIRNVTGKPITSLSLTAVFYDNTTRRRNGSITLPVATSARPFQPDTDRWLYFSSPRTVHRNHQLAVIILWKGRFLREFPVVKRH